jgi:hypothetical protein
MKNNVVHRRFWPTAREWINPHIRSEEAKLLYIDIKTTLRLLYFEMREGKTTWSSWQLPLPYTSRVLCYLAQSLCLFLISSTQCTLITLELIPALMSVFFMIHFWDTVFFCNYVRQENWIQSQSKHTILANRTFWDSGMFCTCALQFSNH